MTHTQIVATSVLDIACEISGPDGGTPVILLHGWPDDTRTWDRVLPALHSSGCRTYVPYLRGFGRTRFRAAETMRSGQVSALGRDVLELADGLGLERFAVIGHDWGARAAYVATCLAPDRVTHCVTLSVGWGTNSPDQPLSLRQVQNYWYHWYMALDRGERLVREERRAFTHHIWRAWTPNWDLSDAEFAATAAAFDNPDWAEVVLHSYRVRWGLAATDPRYAETERRLADDPRIASPTLLLHGAADPCNEPATSEGKEGLFTSTYRRVLLDGVGHFPQREAADHVAAEILAFLG
ncbi:hydrolase [Aliidongia dinghuensis]|uniref:Hydrolase n=1 Tax=Aliidongia dinghuensis TaxID=1867774 RepID=A0A8J2YSM4_9PROT|nr:alpha/beta hydrolase [Aliidongia dinghuensis]GGF14464.1 hydrolase [Aliidongia dinghuensis]